MNAPVTVRAGRDERPLFRTPEPPVDNQRLQQSQFRLMVVMLLFIFATLVIAARLVQLCLFGDRGDRGPAAISVPRGEILDRNGMTLATTIEAWTLAVNPQAILGDRNRIAARLAVLLPQRSEDEYRRILWSNRKFVYLGRHVLPSVVAQVHAIGEPAIMELREARRLYPQASVGGHVLGYAQIVARRSGGEKLTGIGVERYFDDDLRAGKTVQLSIDTRVQAALDSEIGKRVAETQAAGGAGVVLDVDTGEVLALASLPEINPNAPLASIDDIPDKVTLSTYELGSTFKMITFANAIESGVITDWSKTWDVTHPLHVGGFTIHDDEPMHRWITTPEIMTFSSNIGTAQIADILGPERTQAMFRKLNFYDRTSIQLRERGLPQVPHYWARTTVMTTAYGHGIAVTPLHLAVAYAALANGGILHPATLLKHQPGTPVPGRRVIAQSTSDKIRELMRLVVLQGTGTNADAPGLRVGGKTGTAEKVEGRGYDHHANITVFAAVFPMDHPRYVVLTLLDDAKGSKATAGWATAGWMTAPLTKRIIKRIGPLLGVRPDDSRDIDVSDLMPLILEKKVPGKNVVE